MHSCLTCCWSFRSCCCFSWRTWSCCSADTIAWDRDCRATCAAELRAVDASPTVPAESPVTVGVTPKVLTVEERKGKQAQILALKVRSPLLVLSEILHSKSSNLIRNQIGFLQILQKIRHANCRKLLAWLLGLKVTSMWAVPHATLLTMEFYYLQNFM